MACPESPKEVRVLPITLMRIIATATVRMFNSPKA